MNLFSQRKGGCPNACICMGTRSHSLYNRTARLMFTKLGRDGPAHVLRCFRHIHPGADPGQGKNRSKGGVGMRVSS